MQTLYGEAVMVNRDMNNAASDVPQVDIKSVPKLILCYMAQDIPATRYKAIQGKQHTRLGSSAPGCDRRRFPW